MKPPKLGRKQIAIITVVTSFLLGFAAFLLKDQILNLKNLGYLGVFLISLFGAATIFLPLPTFVATIAGGAILNPFLVGLLSALGSAIGELTGYYAGVGGEEFVKKDKNIQKVEKWMDKHGLWVVFSLAVIPNPFFDAAGIIAGASGIPVKKYLTAVFFGKLIRFLFLAYLGTEIISIFHFNP